MTHRTLTRSILTTSLALMVLALAGCGGQAPASSWPGLTPGDGVVYLAATAKAYAINVADGTRKWEYEHKVATSGLLGSGSATDTVHAQPVVGEGLVYLGTDGGYLIAVDAITGAEKWKFVPETPSVLFGLVKEKPGPVYAGPVLAGKRVIFVGTSNKVYALDAATGKLAQGWEPYNAGERVWGTPLVVGDTIYVSTLGHKLIALDATTGTERWKFEQAKGTLAGSPVFDNGVIYVGSFDDHLYAVDAASGALRWSYNANNWIWEGPAVVSGTLYFGDVSGNVYALDEATQQRLWVTDLSKLAVPGSAVRATPLYADGVLYVGTGNGTLFALRADTGKEVWPQPFKLDNAQFLATPLMQSGLLLVAPLGTPTQLYGLNPANNEPQWRFPVPPSK